MKTYLLSYDPLSTALNGTQLLTFIQESRKISQYYAPFIGTYVFKSESPTFDLQEMFAGIFNTTLFIVVEVQQGAAGGRLPNHMWPFVNGQQLNAFADWLPKPISGT